jgi:uncharacterized protein (DUF302 family)
MKYYNSKILHGAGFEETIARVTEVLKEEGFGVLTEIDIKETMKKKLGKDYLPHKILGACNPVFADKALSADRNISAMLPCNVTVKQLEGGEIEVASINPTAAMGSIGNPELVPIANEVQSMLQKIIDKI